MNKYMGISMSNGQPNERDLRKGTSSDCRICPQLSLVIFESMAQRPTFRCRCRCTHKRNDECMHRLVLACPQCAAGYMHLQPASQIISLRHIHAVLLLWKWPHFVIDASLRMPSHTAHHVSTSLKRMSPIGQAEL